MILEYIQANLAEWLFALISFILSLLYAYITKKQKLIAAKNDAIAEGVKSLLRESIVSNYNKYQERGYCPIYAKESIKKVYEAYHDLGGNDVATKLYHTLLDMPEEPKEEKERNET